MGSVTPTVDDNESISDAVLRRPVIVLGAPRSGTTLLANLLASYPGAAAAREPRLVWRYGNDRLSDELRPEHATTKVVDHIRRAFATLVREEGGQRLVEKSPANSLRPWFVDAVFPDARYVHITRNGWGAVPSMARFWIDRSTGLDAKQLRKTARRLREAEVRQLPYYAQEFLGRVAPRFRRTVRLYGPRLAGMQALAEELGVLETAALQWRTCVERSASFGREIGATRYLEVKLEELDAASMRVILDFCEFTDGEELVDRLTATYALDAACRRVALSAEERRRLAPIIEPANAFLGYARTP
jgi:hypothetical protein